MLSYNSINSINLKASCMVLHENFGSVRMQDQILA